MSIKHFLAMACLLAGFSQAAQAVDVAGVQIEDTVKVGNKELKLNGVGVRSWAVFKVYVAALYVTEKKTTTADVLAQPGPRRMKLVLMRKVNNEELGQAFMDGLNANADKSEKSKYVNQTVKMGEIFASIPSLNKGDTITSDWIPGSGMKILVNDKQVGETLEGTEFANAFLKIWLGDKPVDNGLKQKLLGGS